jgi:aryl-alcohol dehydrogenase-like predicted oxidoreductase
MRYRPFGVSGAAISNLTLSFGLDSLARGREAALNLLYSALEAGVNSYRLETADPVVAEVLGEALAHVDRKLVCVGLTLGVGAGREAMRDFTAEGMTAAIDRALHFSGLNWIDVAVLHEPGEHELPQSSLNALKALRATGRIKLLGVAGDGEVMDTYVSTGAFDVLLTPFDINADWRLRNRIRAAREQDMAVFAYDYFTDRRSKPRGGAEPVAKKGLFGLGGAPKRPPQSREADAFGFLYRTPNWPAEAICLSYVLTDPTISSVIVRANDVERLDMLAATPERDLPPGLAAQIEMGRVTASAAA